MSTQVNDTPIFQKRKSVLTEESDELVSPPHILQNKLSPTKDLTLKPFLNNKQPSKKKVSPFRSNNAKLKMNQIDNSNIPEITQNLKQRQDVSDKFAQQPSIFNDNIRQTVVHSVQEKRAIHNTSAFRARKHKVLSQDYSYANAIPSQNYLSSKNLQSMPMSIHSSQGSRKLGPKNGEQGTMRPPMKERRNLTTYTCSNNDESINSD